MPTDFTERITIILPVARVANFGTWWAANIDPADDCTTWPALNAAGDNSPATHRWCSTALTLQQIDKLLARLTKIAQITPPSNWPTRSRRAKQLWLTSQTPTIAARTGVSILVGDNAGDWGEPHDAINAMGLKPCSSFSF